MSPEQNPTNSANTEIIPNPTDPKPVSSELLEKFAEYAKTYEDLTLAWDMMREQGGGVEKNSYGETKGYVIIEDSATGATQKVYRDIFTGKWLEDHPEEAHRIEERKREIARKIFEDDRLSRIDTLTKI